MRIRPIGLLLSGVVVATSACSVDATAPEALASRSAATALGDLQGTSINVARTGDASTYVVRFNPNRDNLLRFGDHTLDIPAGAVCDSASGYGPSVFALDCASEHQAVTITAIVSATKRGIPRIDLMPEMRFNPRTTVTLTLSVPGVSAATAMPRILYCPTLSADECFDESVLDPSLAAHVDEAAGTVFRRIKHFSGYFLDN